MTITMQRTIAFLLLEQLIEHSGTAQQLYVNIARTYSYSKKSIEARLNILSHQGFVDKKKLTLSMDNAHVKYSITDEGRAAFEEYVEAEK